MFKIKFENICERIVLFVFINKWVFTYYNETFLIIFVWNVLNEENNLLVDY